MSHRPAGRPRIPRRRTTPTADARRSRSRAATRQARRARARWRRWRTGWTPVVATDSGPPRETHTRALSCHLDDTPLIQPDGPTADQTDELAIVRRDEDGGAPRIDFAEEVH